MCLSRFSFGEGLITADELIIQPVTAKGMVKIGKWFKVKVMGKGKIDLTVKPTAKNQKLQNAINQLYRPNATVGNGSTMDAIRHELNTGQLVGGKSHLQKGQERVKNLENILKKEQLSPQDKALAEALLQDLKAALSGK